MRCGSRRILPPARCERYDDAAMAARVKRYLGQQGRAGTARCGMAAVGQMKNHDSWSTKAAVRAPRYKTRPDELPMVAI